MDDIRVQFDKAWELISSSGKIVLATHEEPDGDGLSSMLAFHFLLRGLGKENVLFVKEELPSYLRFLPGVEQVQKEIPEGDELPKRQSCSGGG